ncbi:MAG TPA: fused MFS/spermidine synthase [Gemmatimonadaceae bacterium]
MTTAAAQLSSATPARAPYLPALILLFIGSGCAALVYEVVWFQMLSLSLGSSAISLGVLLGTFMGGMCLGSLLLPRFVTPSQHPVRIYALLEAGIGVMGLVILFVLPYAGGLYTTIGGPGFGGLLVRGLIAALCLLPPTLMMGATLPAIARFVSATPTGVSWLGFFYGGNIVGAVFGTLLAGFYLLRNHDVMFATFVAVGINFVVAALAFAYSKAAAHTATVSDEAAAAPMIPPGAWPVYVTIALSGMSALGAEVVWTRLLTLLLGGTVYTFSLILAAFLVGLGAGSSFGAAVARNVKNPRTALGACQLLIVVAIAWAAYSATTALPYWPVNPALAPTSTATFQIDLVRALWVVLPGAVLWGMSFPLALAAIAEKGQDPGRLVASVYAANTVGAILGAMLASLVGIATLGTQGSQRALMILAAISALLMFTFELSREGGGRLQVSSRGGMFGILTVGLTAWLISTVAPVPPILVAYGRYAVTWMGSHGEFIYVGEGMNSSMAVSREASGALNYHNAGKVQASSLPQDMRLQRMLGHLTTLVPANPSSVLVIGCGAGVTAGAVSISPSVDSVVIAEIEPLVPRVVSTYFSEHNYDVVRNPKVRVQIDDARHYLLTTSQTFDAITSDPFDPWVKGAATLYTKEFFEVIRDHLNDGGVITVFVQLYESGMQAVKSEVATFLEVFPNGMIFGNTHQGGGYDVVLLGQKGDAKIDVDRIEQRLASPEFANVVQSLAEIGFYSGTDLLSTFAAQGPMLRPWLSDAQVNRDRNLRLQYLAGLGVNKYEQAQIYSEILQYRQIPENLFVGSPERLQTLYGAIMNRY